MEFEKKNSLVIGIISDTHGLLRSEAIQKLMGVQWLIHAGDIGNADILNRLRSIAPLYAVRGNIDRGEWAQSLPASLEVELAGIKLLVLHTVQDLDIDPVTAGYQVVVSGHSHRPSTERREGVLFINPGSAGPRRFYLPVTLAKLTIDGNHLDAQIIDLLSEPNPSEQ